MADIVTDLFDDYANDDLCASELKETEIYKVVRKILNGSETEEELKVCSNPVLSRASLEINLEKLNKNN